MTTTDPIPTRPISSERPIAAILEDRIWRKLRKTHQGRNAGAVPVLVRSRDRSLALAIRFLPGHRERFLEMVKLAVSHHDPFAEAWYTVFNTLTDREQRGVALDDVCLAADVPSDVLMGICVQHAMKWGREAGYLVAATNHPRVLRAMVANALRPTGVEDRRMLMQGVGFLPTAKPAQINVNATANANAVARAASLSTPGMPTFLQDVESARSGIPSVIDVESDEATD